MADEEQKEGIRQKIKSSVDALFARIGKLSKLHRLLICVGTLIVLGGAYYYLVYAPKVSVLKAAREELKAQEQKLDIYKAKARSLKKFEEKMAQVQGEFNQAMKALPDKKELPSLLVGVSKAGGNAGLEFLLFQPEPEVNKEFYKEIPLSMTVSGSYSQVADFFFQVANLNRIVNIRDLSITIDPQQQGRVQMKCSAVTYMFSEQVADTGKKKGKKK